MKKISIIVPAYNAEKTLERCLNSLVNQTYSEIEIIVIDDGSTDTTYELAKSYCQSYENIILFKQANQGVSIARNKGLDMATGDYIMFVDSDDTIENNACEYLIEQCIENTDLIIFGLNIYKNGELLRQPHLQEKNLNIKQSAYEYWNLRKINLGPCNKIYHRRKIEKYFDSGLSLGEDTKFVIDYMNNIDNIKVLEKCLYNVFLDNTNSLNRKMREDKLYQLIIVRDYEEKFMIENYGAAISELYNEYFLDLHSVLFDVIKYKMGFVKFKENIGKKNYKNIYFKTHFKRKYYRIFSFFIKNDMYVTAYAMLYMRKMILSIIK